MEGCQTVLNEGSTEIRRYGKYCSTGASLIFLSVLALCRTLLISFVLSSNAQVNATPHAAEISSCTDGDGGIFHDDVASQVGIGKKVVVGVAFDLVVRVCRAQKRQGCLAMKVGGIHIGTVVQEKRDDVYIEAFLPDRETERQLSSHVLRGDDGCNHAVFHKCAAYTFRRVRRECRSHGLHRQAASATD